jgi:glycosyltransferase involved in cell wall biosynthesis
MVTTVSDTLRSFLLPFAEHFRARGFRVDAMAREVSGCPVCVHRFDRVWDVDWSRNPFCPRNFLASPEQVRKIVTSQGYDLVHVHTPVAAFVTRFALRQLRAAGRTRVIYTAHGFHFYRGGPRLRGAAFRTLEKVAGNWTDYLVVINREDEQTAERYRLVAPGRVRFMPGIGVDTDLYRPEAVPETEVARVRADLSLKPQDRLFLMAAEFNPGKRHRDALRAFARLGRPEAILALAGVGHGFEEMQRVAAELGVAQRVRFLGFREDIPALLRASVCLLLPSEREGLPRSVLESLSLAVPVIGTRIRGMTELLDTGCGLLVPVGDVDRLAEAMAHILDHPDRARSMGARGRRLVADYDLRKVIQLHEDLYDEALRPQAASNGEPSFRLSSPASRFASLAFTSSLEAPA